MNRYHFINHGAERTTVVRADSECEARERLEIGLNGYWELELVESIGDLDWADFDELVKGFMQLTSLRANG